jgi:hypothetical protein
MSKKYRLPIEKNIERLEDAAADAVDRGDLQRATELLAMTERAESELDGQDTARAERVRDKLAAYVTPGPISNSQELGAIRRRVRGAADGALAQAGSLVEGYEGRRLPDDRYRQFRSRVDSALHLLEQDRELRQLAKAKSGVKVTREERVYGAKSENSYFADLATRQMELPNTPKRNAAEARLQRYGAEISWHVNRGDKEGRYAQRCIRENTRTERADVHERKFQEEQRAVGTGGGATASAGSEAAAFVSPYFLLSDWAPYRAKARAFADQCHSWPLPDYGMRIYIPFFSSTTTATAQTEGSAVSESSPAAGLEGAEVQTASGQVRISQQLQERGYTANGSFDKVLGAQIYSTLQERVDIIALTQAINNGEAVTGQAEFKVKNFYQDLALGREKLADTAGTRLRPTHLFTTTDLYSFITRQVDATTERPIVTPKWAPWATTGKWC